MNGTSYLNGSTTVNGNTLKITNNSNTLTIGSQNTSWTHIYASANIPFIFNNRVCTTVGGLGNSTYPWSDLWLKGPIYYQGTAGGYTPISFKDSEDVYGLGVIIGAGGLTCIGGGESAGTVAASISNGGSEQLCLSNDGVIDFYTNCQNGMSSAVHTIIDTAGIFSGGVNSSKMTDMAFTWPGSYTTGSYMLIWNNETGANGGQLFKCINQANTATWVDAQHKWTRIGGDTMTGNLHVQKAGEAQITAINTETSCRIYLDSDALSSNGNHGIYSNGYWDGSKFVSSGKWLIVRAKGGGVTVNADCSGNAATASKLTDITTNDTASSSDVKRNVWISYANNTTGRPAYTSNLTYQTSTNTLFVPNITSTGTITAPTFSGNATTATTASKCSSADLTSIALTWSGSYTTGSWMLIYNNETGTNGGALFRAINQANTATWVDGAHKWARIGGDTFTGSVTCSGAGERYLRAWNTNNSIGVYLDSDSNGNHGIWSNAYGDSSSSTSSGKWMIYRNSSGEVIVNGTFPATTINVNFNNSTAYSVQSYFCKAGNIVQYKVDFYLKANTNQIYLVQIPTGYSGNNTGGSSILYTSTSKVAHLEPVTYNGVDYVRVDGNMLANERYSGSIIWIV